MDDGHSGTLYVVATPIGNLGDLSTRAIETLEEVDVIACEDTRRTGRLLAGLGLKKKLLSLHEHNEAARLEPLLAKLRSGAQVALVSDAGTPLVSDPGYRLVRAAVSHQLRVRVVPGPSAALTALVGSGLPPHPFTFLGFAPPKPGKRRSFFERFADLDHTLVFFESPHRLIASLRDALEVMGDRPAAISRELTKLHEEILRGGLGELVEELERRERLRGEFVVVLGGKGTRR